MPRAATTPSAGPKMRRYRGNRFRWTAAVEFPHYGTLRQKCPTEIPAAVPGRNAGAFRCSGSFVGALLPKPPHPQSELPPDPEAPRAPPTTSSSSPGPPPQRDRPTFLEPIPPRPTAPARIPANSTHRPGRSSALSPLPQRKWRSLPAMPVPRPRPIRRGIPASFRDHRDSEGRTPESQHRRNRSTLAPPRPPPARPKATEPALLDKTQSTKPRTALPAILFENSTLAFHKTGKPVQGIN